MLSNLRKYFAFTTVGSLLFTRGVFLLYLAYRGLSVEQILLYQAIFSITTAVFEVPTGLFGDRFGRKNSLLVGCALLFVHALGMLVYPAKLFIVLGILEAVAYTFVSGADQALLYELVEHEHNKERYLSINSKLMAVQSVITGVAISLGSVIAEKSWELIYIIMLVVYALQVIILLSIKHDEHIAGEDAASELAELCNPSKIKKVLLASSWIALFIVLSSLLDGVYMSNYTANQLFLEMVNAPIKAIGLFFALSYVLSAAMYVGAERISSVLGDKSTLIISCWVEALLFVALLFCTTKPVIFFVISIIACLLPEGIFLLSENIVQQNIRDEFRNTVLSLVSLLRSAFSFVVYALLGWFLSRQGMFAALAFVGIVSMALSAAFTLFFIVKN